MENLRDYRFSDLELISSAHRIVQALERNLVHFEKFHPKMNRDFFTQFITTLEEVEGKASDNVYIDIQAKQTQEAENCRKQSIQTYRQLLFFVEQAYPKNKPMWQQFGTTSLDQARHNDERMSWFLKLTAHACHLFREDLLSVNCPESLLDKIETLSHTMEKKTFEKICSMKERQHQTLIRVELMNSLWNSMQQIHRVARIIFDEQPILLNEFELPKGNRRMKETVEEQT